MDPVPSVDDLVWLFETDALGESDESWQEYWPYSSISFTTVRGDYVVGFSLNPGYEDAEVTLSRNGQQLVMLSLSAVISVVIERLHGAEELVLRFRERSLTPLRLRLKPQLLLTWGTNLAPPEF